MMIVVFVPMQPCVAAMVRIEHMDFLLPMKIGEVAQLTAEIVYTSAHSLLVEIKVHAENIFTGKTLMDVSDCYMHSTHFHITTFGS